jgi:flagellar basal-body rod protein FlgC
MQAFEISRSGMDIEWRRLEVIAQNIANANTSRTAMGGTYQPMRLVSGPRSGFASHLSSTSLSSQQMNGVQTYGVEPMNTTPLRVYDPAHPHADAKGFVSYPGIDHVGEMTLLVKTSRAYEANVVAMNAARAMYTKAFELGNR